MELVLLNPVEELIKEVLDIESSKSKFIEANTTKVSLSHLKEECIIPVFAKDNETTISHYDFINSTLNVVRSIVGENTELLLDIRVSHVIKGRIPSAIGKPAKELLEHEKTLYYERMAFMIEIPSIYHCVNGNKICLCIGGVRAYNQENLHAKKSLEKFKVFIGYQNKVCTNLCISTDGLKADLRVSTTAELEQKIYDLCKSYDRETHLQEMDDFQHISMNETQFAHLIGKMKMYSFQDRSSKDTLFPILLTDSQINTVVKDYHSDADFCKQPNGDINMWKFFNLLTEANKSTYIDSNLERNSNAYEFVKHLVNRKKRGERDWYTI